jgi:hypothetical protein
MWSSERRSGEEGADHPNSVLVAGRQHNGLIPRHAPQDLLGRYGVLGSQVHLPMRVKGPLFAAPPPGPGIGRGGDTDAAARARVETRVMDASLTDPGRLLCRLDAWPLLRVERRGAHAVLYGGDRGLPIGTVDVRTGTLTVPVRSDLRGPLLASHPELEVANGGVRLEVTDAERRVAAEALVRWRIGLERFAPQEREASP